MNKKIRTGKVDRTIHVSAYNHKRLEKYGSKGETFNMIIGRLLDKENVELDDDGA